MDNVKDHWQEVLIRIANYEKTYGRRAQSVSLLAVSKDQSVDKILFLHEAGQKAFGENYLQDALKKIQHLQNKPIEWHFIGTIQSNKTQKIASNFQWVHSVADLRVAKRLNDGRPLDLPLLNVCLEVNMDAERTKSGVSPDEISALAAGVMLLPRLSLRGIMAIPERRGDFNEQREVFRRVRELFDRLRQDYPELDTLSMGMTEDMEAAIAEGTTMVRIGTAIFGIRTRAKKI